VLIGAAPGSGATGLLATGPGRRRPRRCQVGQRGSAFGFTAEQALLEGADLGLERIDLLVEQLLALQGTLVQGLPKGGLTPGLELGGQARADGTRARGQRRGTALRGGLRKERERFHAAASLGSNPRQRPPRNHKEFHKRNDDEWDNRRFTARTP